MSSASTAPRWFAAIQCSQSTPRRWYSRSSACTEPGSSMRVGAGDSMPAKPPASAACQSLPTYSMGSESMRSMASWRSSASETSPPVWKVSLKLLARVSAWAASCCQPGCSSLRAISALRMAASSSDLRFFCCRSASWDM